MVTTQNTCSITDSISMGEGTKQQCEGPSSNMTAFATTISKASAHTLFVSFTLFDVF